MRPKQKEMMTGTQTKKEVNQSNMEWTSNKINYNKGWNNYPKQISNKFHINNQRFNLLFCSLQICLHKS